MQLTINNKQIAKVKVADTFFKRFKGLMFDKSLGEDECLVIYPCNMIHTCFMKYTIDVIFVDKEDNICGIERGIKPFKNSKYYKYAEYVMEFREGFIDKYDIKIKDKIIYK